MRGNQRIARIMTLAGKKNASARIWKKSGDYSRNARPCFIHQRFDFDASRECRFLGVSHLR
jgi:hypothetical protein